MVVIAGLCDPAQRARAASHNRHPGIGYTSVMARTRILLKLSLLLPLSLLTGPAPRAGSFLCDDLSTIPIDFSVDYETEVQPIFTSSCANCHVESPFPSAGLRLDAGKSLGDLVNVTSTQNAQYIRVVPFSAAQSLLFSKVNCEEPEIGARMPQGRSPISLDAQARIYDWIQQGALATPAVPDLISRAEFETRG